MATEAERDRRAARQYALVLAGQSDPKGVILRELAERQQYWRSLDEAEREAIVDEVVKGRRHAALLGHLPAPVPEPEPVPRAAVGGEQPLSAAGLTQALARLGVQIRLNLRGRNVEHRRDGGGWLAMAEDARAVLREDVAEAFSFDDGRGGHPPWRVTHRLWTDFMLVVAQQHPVDPFAQWLDGLPPWDGDARLDDLLNRAFVIDADTPCELVRWSSSSPIIAAAQRARHPGAEYPHMVVLSGVARDEHLDYWRAILPTEWIGQRLDLRSQGWEQSRDLARSVISDCGGLADSRTAGRSLRRLIPSTTDTLDRVDVPRRGVVVAASANADCLPLETSDDGMCVPIEVIQPTGCLPTDQAQLWAEALVRAEAFDGHLPEALRGAQRTAALTSTARPDNSVDLIRAWGQRNPGAIMPAYAIVEGAGCPHNFEGRTPQHVGRAVKARAASRAPRMAFRETPIRRGVGALLDRSGGRTGPATARAGQNVAVFA